jgi:SAM-dependent methyltransferase
MTERRRVEEFWNRSREYYEQAQERNPQAAPERVELFAYLEGRERVLDVGSGSCENALWLPAGCRYVGVDVSTTALAMAEELKRPGTRARSEADALPFASGCFDAVLSTWAIEHFYDPAEALIEAVRVLRPGGLLLLVGSAWDLPWSIPPSIDPRRRPQVAVRRLARQLRGALGGIHRFDLVRRPRVLEEGYLPDADAVHVAHAGGVRRFLEAAGLEIVEQYALAHAPAPRGARGWLRRALAAVPLWRYGWGSLFIVGRRGAEWRRPPYRLEEI